MNLAFFTVSIIICIVIYSKINESFLNAFTFLVIPYLAVILLNNLLMYRIGFYLVSKQVLLFLFECFFTFWMGGIFVQILGNSLHNNNLMELKNGKQVIKYNYSAMFKYVAIIASFMIIRLLWIVKSRGLSYIGSGEFSGYLMSGILGKFMISCYPLATMLLYAWFENKKKISYILLFLIVLILTFLTFIKYHIISLIIITFIYLLFKNKKYASQTFLVFLISIPAVFVLNYFVSFKVRGMLVDQSFYLQHFWSYVGGSPINDENILNGVFRSSTSLFYNLGIFIFPLLNMFLSPLGISLPQLSVLPFFQIGTTSQMSTNVVDQFTSLYNSPDFDGKFFFFLIIIFLFGSIGELFARKLKYPINDGSLLFGAAFSNFFLVLGFFGAFYSLPIPWMWMIFSWIIPSFFVIKS